METWTGSEWWDITHHQCAWLPEEQSVKCPSGTLRGVYECH